MFSKMFDTINLIDMVSLREHVNPELAIVYKIFGTNFEAKLYWGVYENLWLSHIQFLGEDKKLKSDVIKSGFDINHLVGLTVLFYERLYNVTELTIIQSVEIV